MGVASSVGLLVSLGFAFGAAEAKSVAVPSPFEMPVCENPAGVTPTKQASVLGDPEVRSSAQRGLTFLENSASSWASGHECFGCHVHAVTVEALSVGVDNGYDVDRKMLEAFIAAMTKGPGGERNGDLGLRYAHGDSLRAASNGFGGAAFARYDALVDSRVRDDLVSVAKRLLTWQAEDGGITDPENWTNTPVGTGRTQLTSQAVTTWRQAYERTADDAWLAAIARAEGYFQTQINQLSPASADLQQLNYALLGMMASGGTVSEGSVTKLIGGISALQGVDGGFALNRGGASDAFATGQTMYTLRRLGMTDADPVLAKGTAWLVKNQTAAGGWRSGGFEKAEAMWAVLGLVSIDVLTLTVEGLTDGQHVDGTLALTSIATSNRGRGIKEIELLVDDLPIDGGCGGRLLSSWNTSGLDSGRHIVEVRAKDGDGKLARRRFEVYAGNAWLTRLGTRWDDDGTAVTIRNLSDEAKGIVRLELLSGDKVVHTEGHPARPGANTFWWRGAEHVGKRLTARVSLVEAGVVIQTENTDFVHADPNARKQSYGEIAGAIGLKGAGASANTVVELLDERGEVVQRTVTTDEGNYRFKDVDDAKYKVRVSKKGFKGKEADVEAKKGEETETEAIELE